MRIIGGTARSRRLKAPRGAATRPTSDRVREAIFNILGPPPAEARVLDLFAGAGGLGLEALSRGAASAVFVDKAAAAVSCLRNNIAALQMADVAEIIATDAVSALKRLGAAGHRFHWVFVDPPYDSELAAAAIVALGGGDVLGEPATVIVEHDRRRAPTEVAGVLTCADRRVYGDTAVSFYGRVSP